MYFVFIKHKRYKNEYNLKRHVDFHTECCLIDENAERFNWYLHSFTNNAD